MTVLDLPGAYSLNPTSADEAITRDVVLGALAGEAPPDLIVCVTDATNLQLNLRMVLEVRRFGVPMVLALNMADVARQRGIVIDTAALARELGVPVVETVAVRRGGADGLIAQLAHAAPSRTLAGPARHGTRPIPRKSPRRTAKCGASSPRACASRPPTCGWTMRWTASCCTRCGEC